MITADHPGRSCTAVGRWLRKICAVQPTSSSAHPPSMARSLTNLLGSLAARLVGLTHLMVVAFVLTRATPSSAMLLHSSYWMMPSAAVAAATVRDSEVAVHLFGRASAESAAPIVYR